MGHGGEIFAFIFDSGDTGSNFYGQVIFENMICGRELVDNPFKMIVSLGDCPVDMNYFGMDIEPYVYKDKCCTVDFKKLSSNSFRDYPFVWIIEDIIPDIATLINDRLSKSFTAYIGMFRINQGSTSEKKQFWKRMIRSFAISKNTIFTFVNEEGEGPFYDKEILNKYGYIQRVHEANSYSTLDDESFRQSNLVKTEKDLEVTLQKTKEIDRDLTTLNFSIREELQIAGVLIWKSIHSLDKICFDTQTSYLVEYPFMTLYFASQGIERIQKTLIELICKNKHILESEKNKAYDLLMSHSHNGLNDWIEANRNVSIKKSGKNLLGILSDFYNTIRYARYNDETYLKSKTPEIDLLRKLKERKEEGGDYIKKRFGKFLWEIANKYYNECCEICHELKIYAYELDYDSSSNMVYSQRSPENLYERYKIIQQYKKEVLYWIIKNNEEYPKYAYCELDALQFDPAMIDTFLNEIIYSPEGIYSFFDSADDLYDELCTTDKKAWKQRIDLIDFLFNDILI
ncbi:hypothetical protein [uncultured Abiotrophia sp.]|uniref:hypothetical protein n=1 Tax=uncultured Abiotrophia sp. TaxID=316094 RepID=UPI00260E86BA|nr:hypothetical protein [uncultured Abiotrophia sp.]